ncbi:putative P-loop containing nucleoside triphosphate hydrolase, leucine-rich repeat domain superfamily [Helianthus annuus]|nr:putative P-loop containing nucleoside triphosphate hydrolase, leucine-rich repeat domain superfamily [Helianthus annuus]KAJ0925055.1 putative P-loop containing nucleoside triphosphate hydrolase, leucine-rich repeat domain superfamily [Helianthus annuus]
MEPRLQDLQESLDITSNEVRMIGIKGMGGAGKTTLARAAFDRLSIHFKAKTFVENVKEVSKASSGLLSLQKKILTDLAIGSYVSSVHEGTKLMKKKLRFRRVLVVLDDVDDKDQLDALAGDVSWFKPGSRIIITSRDEQVLIAHKVKWIHDVNLLSDEEAIGLFSRHTFGKDIPVQEYKTQSLEVVHFAAGLPLTIKVLGSFLCGKDKLEWIDALARLKTIPLEETIAKLEVSFKGLENAYKEIFLDVACLLKGWEKNKAIRMLESSGFDARNGLRVLEQRSLITFRAKNLDFYLSMHDHIEEMGKNIVRRLHKDEPNLHSRLWIQEEIEDVLCDDLVRINFTCRIDMKLTQFFLFMTQTILELQGTEVTQCMNLKLTPTIVGEGLRNMKKLRCLIVNHRESGMDCDDLGKIEEFCLYFPNALRYLNWHYYPHSCLPKTFEANNLVALEMFGSGIEQLWVGGKVMRKLKSIDLSFSKTRTLDLGVTPNLERLDLQSCYDLEELHVPAGCLKTLVYLDLGQCERLKSFLFIKELESLEVLNLKGLHLTEFPDIIPNHSNSSLQRLDFRDNDIENLPSSIGNLHRLVYLCVTDCVKLKGLPASICSLQHLKVLDFERCGIEELPENIGQLQCLEKLDLTCLRVKYLPNSICMLKHLNTLIFPRGIEELPENIGQLECLEKLEISYSKVKYLPDSICMLKHLKTLLLPSCLDKLPEDLGGLESLEELDLRYCKIREIPNSICKLKHLKTLMLDGCLVCKLPEDLGRMESLEKLSLNECKIREIPSSICKLKHLKTLNLKCCGVRKLPEDFGQIESLNTLNLGSSKFREIPTSICNLKHLKVLYLSGCSKLKKLPESLGDLESLEDLDLTDCKIRDIPSSVCKLKRLKFLDLEGCKVHELPEDLGQIKSLNYLSLKSSKIREIPSSICKLKHLKELILSHCYTLQKLPENLGDLECLQVLDLTETDISLPHSISLLKGLEIIGYERRIDEMVDQASITRHTGAKRSNRLRNMLKLIDPYFYSIFSSSFLHVG